MSVVTYGISKCSRVILPAKHLRVVVYGDVGPADVVVGAKVAVWSTEPFIKAVLQREVLRPVAQMPVKTEDEHPEQISVTEGSQPLIHIIK